MVDLLGTRMTYGDIKGSEMAPGPDRELYEDRDRREFDNERRVGSQLPGALYHRGSRRQGDQRLAHLPAAHPASQRLSGKVESFNCGPKISGFQIPMN